LECRGFGLVKTIALTEIDYNARPGVSTANLTGMSRKVFGLTIDFTVRVQTRQFQVRNVGK
jgi:hypothetical protein